MRAALMVFGILLGVGGVLLYQWIKPPADDPYFFLTPKPTIINDEYYAVEKPIKLYKKGEVVNFVFWNVPQPTPKLLYLFPTSRPAPEIMIRMKKNNFAEKHIYSKVLSEWINYRGGWSGIKKSDGLPFLMVTIKKTGKDLSEKEIYKQEISALALYFIWDDSRFFTIKELNEDYGQYRLTINVLSDSPELSKGLIPGYAVLVGKRVGGIPQQNFPAARTVHHGRLLK